MCSAPDVGNSVVDEVNSDAICPPVVGNSVDGD